MRDQVTGQRAVTPDGVPIDNSLALNKYTVARYFQDENTKAGRVSIVAKNPITEETRAIVITLDEFNMIKKLLGEVI